MNVGVVIGSDESHAARRAIAVEMAREWVRRHKGDVYDVAFKSEYGAPNFRKFDCLLEALSAHDYALWLDSDCCVVDPTFDLKSAIVAWGTPATLLWHAMDWNGLCSCFLLVRRCDWSCNLLRACLTIGVVEEMNGQQDQGTLKFLAARAPGVRWRFGGLPTTIVADQTIKPVPVPFVWHLSMGADTVRVMSEVRDAVLLGRFEEYAKVWPGMRHGVKYE